MPGAPSSTRASVRAARARVTHRREPVGDAEVPGRQTAAERIRDGELKPSLGPRRGAAADHGGDDHGQHSQECPGHEERSVHSAPDGGHGTRAVGRGLLGPATPPGAARKATASVLRRGRRHRLWSLHDVMHVRRVLAPEIGRTRRVGRRT